MVFSAVVVAGGSGVRAGGALAKQWRLLGGKPVLRWSVEALVRNGAREVVVVIPSGEEARAADALRGVNAWRAATGGASRAASVMAGLSALTGAPDEIVLVHDAARPFLSAQVVLDVLDGLKDADGAIPALPVADTIKRLDGGVVSTVDRTPLRAAQTPQAFRRKRLVQAYANWSADAPPTDDAGVVEADGGRIAVVPGDPLLFKLTTPEDFRMAEAHLSRATRMGQGFDAHRFGPGDGVWLCGVHIPHNASLVGHSDADAGLHALTDAILGAIGEGDIGDHFPPSDPQWKGAPSDLFLRHAADLVTARGGRINNVDVTLICEAPKIKPHRQAMRERLADILNLPLDAISVKATTTEAMGFTGRGEGLAAQAVASIDLPSAIGEG
jgi:2-C-methyl-D-erythritol 4-phosphate cytidylyltransferase / 2-C-methyl-D-erythritol 2,4-cyclodiphosphate synthase